MRAILWDRDESGAVSFVDEYEVTDPVPSVIMRARAPKVSIFDNSNTVPDSVLQSDAYLLWKVWRNRGEAAYVRSV